MSPLHAPTLQFVAVLVTLVAAGVSLLTWYHHREGPGLRPMDAASPYRSLELILPTRERGVAHARE